VTVTASQAGEATRTLMLTLVDAGCVNPGSACPLDITGSLNLDGGRHSRDQDRGQLRRRRLELPRRAAAGSRSPGAGGPGLSDPLDGGDGAELRGAHCRGHRPGGRKVLAALAPRERRNGDARDVPVTLHYADGDVRTRVSASDWAAGSPRFGETDLVRTTGRDAMNSASGTDGLAVHL